LTADSFKVMLYARNRGVSVAERSLEVEGAVDDGGGPRSPTAGTREVLGFVLPGRMAPGRVRALLVGSRINMRGLRGFVEPDTLDPRGTGAAFVYRYGVVVLFGVDPGREREFLEGIQEHVIDPLPFPEIETATIELAAGDEEQVDPHGNISLRELTPERLLLTATVLARSVVLGRDETRIAEVFDHIEPVVGALKLHGRAGLSIRRVMRQIGEVLDARHRMVGRAQISEKPEVLWDHPELDRLYGRLEAEYELGDRARVIEHKLEAIGDAADVLLDVVQDRRSVRLELAIIALIAFEIVVGLAEKLL
jgi:required for meiotic nuclear division protein 1